MVKRVLCVYAGRDWPNLDNIFNIWVRLTEFCGQYFELYFNFLKSPFFEIYSANGIEIHLLLHTENVIESIDELNEHRVKQIRSKSQVNHHHQELFIAKGSGG